MLGSGLLGDPADPVFDLVPGLRRFRQRDCQPGDLVNRCAQLDLRCIELDFEPLGVKLVLRGRGMCCLRLQLPGLGLASSAVGRFASSLEVGAEPSDFALQRGRLVPTFLVGCAPTYDRGREVVVQGCVLFAELCSDGGMRVCVCERERERG